MKIPTCNCLKDAIGHNVKHVYIGMFKDMENITVWANFRRETRIRLEGVSLRHNFCPQCGAPYVEAGDKTPHYGAKELEEQLQHAHDELRIVYELADAMYNEIPNGDNIFEAAEAYDEWKHAGETVPEEVE